ncbi:MAG: hypothetical protein QW727_04035 [Candidatus Pacearchaeota archaeon]
MNKNYIIIILFFLIVIPNTSAFFFKNHIKFTLQGFDEVDSPITVMCRDGKNFESFITGVLSADVPVLHYFDNKAVSYLGTHQLGAGTQACLENAGNDEERCFCHGLTLHWLAQDRWSHTQGGLVPKYLKKFLGLNFLGHMVIERNFEKRSMELYTEKKLPIITNGKLDYYDKNALNYLFEEYGGNPNLIKILNRQAGISLDNDARIFRSGYQGEGFYSTVYKDKISLPWWFWGISISMICIGLLIMVLSIFGKRKLKWLLFFEGLLIFSIGTLILISIMTGTTWKITTFLIEIPPRFGYLKVSDKDIIEFDRLAQESTNNYLKTGIILIEDGSGLSYYDKNGNYIIGELTKSQKAGIFLIYGFIIFLFILNILLIKKVFSYKVTR